MLYILYMLHNNHIHAVKIPIMQRLLIMLKEKLNMNFFCIFNYIYLDLYESFYEKNFNERI